MITCNFHYHEIYHGKQVSLRNLINIDSIILGKPMKHILMKVNNWTWSFSCREKPNYLTAEYFRRYNNEIDKIINTITLGLMSVLISLHLFMDPIKHWDEKFVCILLFITCKVRCMSPPAEKPQCTMLVIRKERLQIRTHQAIAFL